MSYGGASSTERRKLLIEAACENAISIGRMLAPSHRTSARSFSLLSLERRARAAFSMTRRSRVVVAVAFVVRMSQRHAFVAYNYPRYALFRFSPSARSSARRRSRPDPSRFSVIAVALGERLVARRYFRTVYLYTKTKTAPSVSRCP